MQTIGSGRSIPIENSAVPVRFQDQTTPAVDTFFSQSTATTFSLTQAATPSDLANLYYVLNVNVGHGIVATNTIQLLDVIADRASFSVVVSVTADTITIDRPIDHAFPVTSLCRRVLTDMAVDGSGIGNEQIYTVRAGSMPIDLIRYNIIMTHASAGDDAKFGDLAALTRGLAFRIVDGYQDTIESFKTNASLRIFSGAPDLVYSDKAGGGTGAAHSTAARITFGGSDKHGIVHRVSGTSAIQFIVQDDLTDLGSLHIFAQGHETD